MQFEFASGQIQGKRAAQEDTVDVLVPSTDGDSPGQFVRSGQAGNLVLVVADGMGGHVGGRIASSLSAKYFLESVDQTVGDWSDRLDAALLRANEVLRNATDARPELSGMGSTLVGGVLTEHGVGWVSVGDSGLYLCRKGALHRLNEDHSFGAYLDQQVREGLIAAETAASDRRRNQLFHALLGDPLDHYERFAGFKALEPGDVVLVASDGLKTLDDAQIGALIAQHAVESPEQLVQVLLSAVEAANRERQDNTSLIIVRAVESQAAAVATGQTTVFASRSKSDPLEDPEATLDTGGNTTTVVRFRAARDALDQAGPPAAVPVSTPAGRGAAGPPARVTAKPRSDAMPGLAIAGAAVAVAIAGAVVAWGYYGDALRRLF